MTREHMVNELELLVVNDGSGELCGMTYRQRCAAADFGLMEYVTACEKAADWLAERGCREANRKEIRAAAEAVQEYYREHTKEAKQ